MVRARELSFRLSLIPFFPLWSKTTINSLSSPSSAELRYRIIPEPLVVSVVPRDSERGASGAALGAALSASTLLGRALAAAVASSLPLSGSISLTLSLSLSLSLSSLRKSVIARRTREKERIGARAEAESALLSQKGADRISTASSERKGMFEDFLSLFFFLQKNKGENRAASRDSIQSPPAIFIVQATGAAERPRSSLHGAGAAAAAAAPLPVLSASPSSASAFPSAAAPLPAAPLAIPFPADHDVQCRRRRRMSLGRSAAVARGGRRRSIGRRTRECRASPDERRRRRRTLVFFSAARRCPLDWKEGFFVGTKPAQGDEPDFVGGRRGLGGERAVC